MVSEIGQNKEIVTIYENFLTPFNSLAFIERWKASRGKRISVEVGLSPHSRSLRQSRGKSGHGRIASIVFAGHIPFHLTNLDFAPEQAEDNPIRPFREVDDTEIIFGAEADAQ
jgi:hypothetical protein